MPTETEASSSLPDPIHDPSEPADRQERWVRAVQRAFRRAIEDEQGGAGHIVRKVDAALRGDLPRE